MNCRSCRRWRLLNWFPATQLARARDGDHPWHRHSCLQCRDSSRRLKGPHMLRLLSRYIFREILSSALIGTFLASFVVFLLQVDKIFDVLVRSTFTYKTVLTLFALAMPPVLPLTI